MNEFMDPMLGRMVAVKPEIGTASCAGCAYLEMICPDVRDGDACCTPSFRDDGRFIIWVQAEDVRQKPKAVQLPYEQIRLEAERSFAEIPNIRELINFTRAIEAAVLQANNLEAE